MQPHEHVKAAHPGHNAWLLARDARVLATHVDALRRHVEQIEGPLELNARVAWLYLRDLAETLDQIAADKDAQEANRC